MNERRIVVEVVDEDVLKIWRKKTPEELLRIGNSMWRFARDLLRASVSQEHPNWTPEQVSREVAHRISHGAV